MDKMTGSVVVKVAWVAGVVFFLGTGLWAFLSPSSFYDSLAVFPPYNPHFLRDVGVFSVGIGVTLVAASRSNDALRVVLGGATVAAVLHVISHIVDADRGGKSTDIPLLSLFAVVLLAGSIARAKERGPLGRAPAE